VLARPFRERGESGRDSQRSRSLGGAHVDARRAELVRRMVSLEPSAEPRGDRRTFVRDDPRGAASRDQGNELGQNAIKPFLREAVNPSAALMPSPSRLPTETADCRRFYVALESGICKTTRAQR